jgi:hypothetical protein
VQHAAASQKAFQAMRLIVARFIDSHIELTRKNAVRIAACSIARERINTLNDYVESIWENEGLIE